MFGYVLIRQVISEKLCHLQQLFLLIQGEVTGIKASSEVAGGYRLRIVHIRASYGVMSNSVDGFRSTKM